QEILELAELRRRGARAVVDADHPGTIVGGLSAEHAGGDARAGAGQRQERYRQVRLLDGERQRGAQLIAVERAVTAGAHPARAVARPILRRRRRRRPVLAGAVVAIAGAARPEILAAGAAAQEALEAKAAFPLHRPRGIAFARGDGIAQPRDQHVAHGDLGYDALRGAVAERDVDGGDGDAPVRHAQDDLALARRLVLAQLSLAVIEGPGTDRALRRIAGNLDADAVIARRDIVLLFAVALAGLHQHAEFVDAEIADDVLGPAQPAGVALQPLLGGKHAVAAARRDLAQEIGLAPEQAEAVLDLPGDVKVAGARKLGKGRIVGQERNQDGEDDEKTHGLWAAAHQNLVAPALRQKCESRRGGRMTRRPCQSAATSIKTP